MAEQILSQPPPLPQDRDDPEYWAQRLENDAFLQRRRWWWRHYLAGSLQSQRRREALRLGREGEDKAAALIAALGYQAHHTTKNCAFDLWVADSAGRAARVEIKTSLYIPHADPRKGGRYEANIRQHRDVDLVVFLAKNGDWWPYIIPIGDIGQRRNIAIWSYCPADYRGQWSIYLDAWQNLDQAIANSHPKIWQLSLPLPLARERKPSWT